MSDIAPIGRSAAAALTSPGRAAGLPAAATGPARGDDSVQVSPIAQMLSRLADNPVRTDLINRVRSEIAAGTYETPDKIEAAMDEMVEDLM